MSRKFQQKREIGGFFEFPSFDCDEPEKSTLHYLTSTAGENNFLFVQDGRQAIRTVLQRIENVQEKKCHLPAYICHSILQPFREMQLSISYYRHTHPLIPNIDGDIHDSVILVIDYFGTESVTTQTIKKMLQQGNTVIIDCTHSILDGTRMNLCHENLYYIASLRKVFPIPDGAVLYYSRDNPGVDMDYSMDYLPILDAMILKRRYINRSAGPSDVCHFNLKNDFLSLYAEHEEGKDKQDIQINRIPLISLLILSNLTFETLLGRRNRNLLALYKTVSDDERFLFNQNEIKSPFMLPLLLESTKKRETLKTLLVKNDIYPPVHWDIQGPVPETFGYEHQISRRILSIPVDQRYSTEDMIRISNILNEAAI